MNCEEALTKEEIDSLLATRKNEINKDFYCSANAYVTQEQASLQYKDGCTYSPSSWKYDYTQCDHVSCRNYHRKHPTPEQYKEEYGREYPEDGAVYCFAFDDAGFSWIIGEHKQVEKYRNIDEEPIVCDCTPFGKPDDNWRPE
jgi:hypothetical protein